MRGFVDVRLCVFEHQIDGRHTKETFPLTFDPGLCAANQTLCMVCFSFFFLFFFLVYVWSGGGGGGEGQSGAQSNS